MWRQTRGQYRTTTTLQFGVGTIVGLVLLAGLVASVLSLPATGASFSDTASNTANTIDADTLDPPTSVVGTGGVSTTVDWSATVDTYAAGYRLFRSGAAGGPYVEIADIADQAVVNYVDSPPDGTYFYVLRSYTAGWESVDSNEATARAWRAFDCPADPDLRLCVRFDVDLGGTYADESAYGNTVTHTNSSQVPGISDMAAEGTAAARHEVADSPSLDVTDAMTIETWARFDSLPAAGTRAGLVDNDGQYSIIYYGGSGLLCSDGIDQLPFAAVPVGVWFHAACAWDGATLTLYLDGQPVESMPSTGTIDASNTNSVGLLNTSPAYDEPLDGAMDNLRIWNSGRTQAQICADAGITGC